MRRRSPSRARSVGPGHAAVVGPGGERDARSDLDLLLAATSSHSRRTRPPGRRGVVPSSKSRKIASGRSRCGRGRRVRRGGSRRAPWGRARCACAAGGRGRRRPCALLGGASPDSSRDAAPAPSSGARAASARRRVTVAIDQIMAYLNRELRRAGHVGAYPRLMGATVDESAVADRLLTEDVALVDRSERGKLALTGPQAKELLSGQVTNDIEALVARQWLLRRAADQQGQDAGRPARARHRRRALARHRARGAAGAVRHPAARRRGLARRSCTSARSSRRCSRSWARTPRTPPAAGSAPSTPTAARSWAAPSPARRHRPRESTSSAPPRTPSAYAAPSTSPRSPRPRPRSCASSPGARATASTSTTR